MTLRMSAKNILDLLALTPCACHLRWNTLEETLGSFATSLCPISSTREVEQKMTLSTWSEDVGTQEFML